MTVSHSLAHRVVCAVAIVAVNCSVGACGRTPPRAVPDVAATEPTVTPRDVHVEMPRLTMRDGPNAWTHEWDDVAVIINDTTVLCPERKTLRDSSKVDLARLRGIAPESVQFLEKRRVVSAAVHAKCPTARRELRMTVRGGRPG